ncbi:MAG: NAD-dependent epimerase/dehydratase family protein [Pseudomonadota bacterium]|nr:NAD-dependent epimerase/dehydratase family protein [Pseudomonadota bacterium]
MRSAFITGAGGFLGGHLCAVLQRQGVALRALAHSDASAAALRAAGIEVVQGEIDDAALLARALTPAPDVVFHLAGDTSVWRRQRARQWRINVDGTLALLDAAIAAGVPRFVYTSSISVYGLTAACIDEDSPRLGLHGPVHYARSKAAAEALVCAAAQSGRISAAVLQPGHILGPGDRHNWSRLAQLIAARRLPGAPPGVGVFADAREVAAAHVAAAMHPAAARAWVLGGAAAPFSALVAALARALHLPAPRRTLPHALLWLRAVLDESAAVCTGQPPALTRESVALACHHLCVDDTRARIELGYRHQPLQTMADDTVAWLQAAHLLAATQ